MNLLVWLILVASVMSNPAAEARRSRQTSRSSRNSRRELSDEDILKALSILLAEADDVGSSREGRDRGEEKRGKSDRRHQRERQARQGGFEGANGNCETTGFEVRNREECNEVTEIRCETVNITKFRNTIVERCQTLFDQKCNVTFNDVPKQKCSPKQRNKCDTEYKIVEDKVYKEECKVDVQHVCEELIPVEVPYPVKDPYHSKPPNPYSDKILPKEPFPPDPYADFIPLLPEQQVPHPLDLHALPSDHGGLYEPPHTAVPGPLPSPTPLPALYLAELDAAESLHHSSPSYSYDPTPAPLFPISPTPNFSKSSTYQTTFEHSPPSNTYKSSQLAFALFNKPSIRLSRKKRSFVFPGAASGPPGMIKQKYHSDSDEENLIKEKLLKEIVTQVLLDVIEKNQALGSVNATIKKQRSIDPINYQIFLDSQTTTRSPYYLHNHQNHTESYSTKNQQQSPVQDLPEDLLLNLKTEEKDEILLELYNELIKRNGRDILSNAPLQQHHHHNNHQHLIQKDINHDPHIGGPLDLHPQLPLDPHHHLPHEPHHHLPHGPHHHLPHDPLYPPIITTHELPAPPGCRSIAIKECHKIPVIVPKKVPYEVCTKVPDIDCITTLKTVPELECVPEVLRECDDIEKKVPYLVPEEECEEVAFDECVTIEEKVPVELCKRKRLNEESITLSKGKVTRKEGEKRRTPIGRRTTDQRKKNRKSSSSKQTSSSSSKQTSSSST